MNHKIQQLLGIDQHLTGQIQLKNPDSPVWRLAAFMAHTGDSWFWAIGMGLVWLFTRGDWHTRSAIFEIAIVTQALLVFGLKRGIHRQRPNSDWGGIYRQIDPHSFPSGHATRAALLLVLALALGPPWLALVLILWTPVMAISRVMTGVHYVSDLAGGMVLGVLLGAINLMISPLWIAWFPFLF